MSVIAEFGVPAADFHVGRVLSLEEGMGATFETTVRSGSTLIPYIWISGADNDDVVERLEATGQVDDVVVIDSRDGEQRYALDWHVSDDPILDAIAEVDATVFRAEGTRSRWEFDVAFPDHAAVKTFHDRCDDADVTLRVGRMYVPTPPEAGPWFGLTDRQREALTMAVDGGYYHIPREVTTLELADRMGISDQAVTERLRRGIATLVENTLMIGDQQH
ncbi:MAG: helix-turn-helix domain-containing protein [Halanaeroarchaeum sp.]